MNRRSGDAGGTPGAPGRRVLYVCHNHPTLYPGGAEGYALQVYEGLQNSASEFEPLFLARLGSSPSTRPYVHPGTPFASVDGHPGQYFVYTDISDFDPLYLTLRNKEFYTVHYPQFLDAHRPAVVHFQHTLYLGYEMLWATRRTLPDAAIVYTLHEYRSVCHRDGQMVRTVDERPCMRSSPRRCHECFPRISPQDFYLRKRFIQSHFSVVDLFLSPSRFLIERYVEWGIPREKIRLHEHGLRIEEGSSDVGVVDRDGQPEYGRDVPDGRPRNRFGFFGQLSRYKGVLVLLQAMELLAEEDAQELADLHLWIHGANLEWQAQEFQAEFHDLVAKNPRGVTFAGRYEPEEIPDLLSRVDWVVVPSLWWENSPRVVQEAFRYGRPVLCSGIGALAEKVTDGVNGLHFRAGDPRSLADAIRTAVSDRRLWDRLRAGIPRVPSIEEDVDVLVRIYRELLAREPSERAYAEQSA